MMIEACQEGVRRSVNDFFLFFLFCVCVLLINVVESSIIESNKLN
jgi:hypothetical protein